MWCLYGFLLFYEGFDVAYYLVYVLVFEAVIEATHSAQVVYEYVMFVVYEVLVYAEPGGVVVGTDEVAVASHVVEFFFVACKEHPLQWVGIKFLAVGFEGFYCVLEWIDGVREEDDVFVALEFFVYDVEVFVHFGANAFAGSKEVFYHHYFVFDVVVGDGFAVLVDEGKWGDMVVLVVADDG